MICNEKREIDRGRLLVIVRGEGWVVMGREREREREEERKRERERKELII